MSGLSAQLISNHGSPLGHSLSCGPPSPSSPSPSWPLWVWQCPRLQNPASQSSLPSGLPRTQQLSHASEPRAHLCRHGASPAVQTLPYTPTLPVATRDLGTHLALGPHTQLLLVGSGFGSQHGRCLLPSSLAAGTTFPIVELCTRQAREERDAPIPGSLWCLLVSCPTKQSCGLFSVPGPALAGQSGSLGCWRGLWL